MNFHKPEILIDRIRATSPEIDTKVIMKRLFNGYARIGDLSILHSVNQVAIENEWIKNKRPYYKVWPSIADSLCRVKLDIPCNAVPVIPCGCLAIRFAETDARFKRIKSILVMRAQDEYGVSTLVISWGCSQANDSDCGAILNIRLDRNTIENGLNDYYGYPDAPQIEKDDCIVTRVAIAVILMSRDPDFVKPDVLAADRQRFDLSTDPEERLRLIDRAARRGVVGWRIGEAYESCPHFRRPHFALRHTGKGGEVPKIVPIKGAVVHRQKLTEVPTGYIDEAGREIENGIAR